MRPLRCVVIEPFGFYLTGYPHKANDDFLLNSHPGLNSGKGEGKRI